MRSRFSGLDPKGRKLRPAQGFEAADYFFPGYWVWNKVIENLAYLGYDNNNMLMMSMCRALVQSTWAGGAACWAGPPPPPSGTATHTKWRQ